MSSSLVIRRVRHLSASVAAAAAAATASTDVSSITASKAKSQLRSVYDPDKALEIYSSIFPGYTSPTYSRYTQEYAVRRLAKSHRFTDIENFLDSHKSDPKITLEPFLCSLIRSYGIAEMFENALSMYNQMDDLGTPRTVASFNTLLSAAVVSKNFDRVPDLFDEMPKRFGIVPNKVSYGILIKAYCEMRKTELALERLKEMEKVAEINAITYTTIIHSLYKDGKNEEADRVWTEMVNKGCTPDVGAYNVKIMHIQRQEPEGVLKLIEEMKNAGLKPDTITYNYLLTCYCINGMFDVAMKVEEELGGYGCKPNAATFRTLIFHLCKHEKFETAHEVFEKSVKAHKIPDFNTLKHLVEGLAKNSDTKLLAKGMIMIARRKFPSNVVKAWEKIEDRLGLVSCEQRFK